MAALGIVFNLCANLYTMRWSIEGKNEKLTRKEQRVDFVPNKHRLDYTFNDAKIKV